MMKTKLFESIRVLAFVFFGFMLMYIVYSALSRLSLSKHDGYQLKALFSDLRQLQVGDDVRVAGVRVGSIIETYLDKDLAVAVLYVEKRYKIPDDSIASILMAGLLGSNYIAITPGHSPDAFKNDAYISTQKTSDLSSVVQRFDKVGRKLDRILGSFEEGLVGENSDQESDTSPKKSSLLKEFGDFFRENRSKLNDVIDHCQTITRHLSQGEGTLGKLIVEDRAYNDLIDMMQSIKGATDKVDTILANFETLLEKVKSGDGLLNRLIADEKTAQDFDCIVKNIRAFCEKLNNEHSTLGHIINDDTLYRKAEDALNKVDRAGDNIANSGPVTALGAAASAIF